MCPTPSTGCKLYHGRFSPCFFFFLNQPVVGTQETLHDCLLKWWRVLTICYALWLLLFRNQDKVVKTKSQETWAMKSGLVPGAHVSRVRPAMTYIYLSRFGAGDALERAKWWGGDSQVGLGIQATWVATLIPWLRSLLHSKKTESFSSLSSIRMFQDCMDISESVSSVFTWTWVQAQLNHL